jgi:8-oxo-dGTP pyrophosphatase MutT (NUDIX family)
MKTAARIDDPRLESPQCTSLTPVGTVHENPWFRVRDRAGYYSVEYRNPQVVVLPIVDRSSIIMVRVHRPLLADITLELPAGGSNDNEMPRQTAVREFVEETGIEISDASRFRELIPMSVTPRYPCLTHIFEIEITALEYRERKEHDDEVASVECFSFGEVLQKIAEGEIYISLPIAVLGRYFLLSR